MNIVIYKDQTDGHDRAMLFATQDLMAKWANEHRDATFMRTIKELIEDHEDEKRVLANQWNEYAEKYIWRAWLHGVMTGVVFGLVICIAIYELMLCK